MTDGTSLDYLYQLLRSSADKTKLENIDFTALNYALYARKSTVGDERQEHSIEDQIALCTSICIRPNQLKVVHTIREKGSAKEPDIRPQFSRLIEDIKNGEIDGIISYHPDRLARNMKEAGELIDLLDKGILKDLRFATSTFENSPTGKMLLGISFVLSKQYSENLSQVVSRGNIRATEERGEFLGKRVHGYYITKDRTLVPDGLNFVVVQKIFQKRLEGQTQPVIAKWANTQNYTVKWKGKTAKSFKWSKASISDLLKDPVYAGILKYGKSLVRLDEHYDFIPAVSVDDFLKINKLSDLTSSKLKSAYHGAKAGDVRADLLRRLIICAECGELMHSGITSKKKPDGGKTDYFYYRCGTESCPRRNKSVRANVVVGFAINFLKQNLFTTPDNYEHYKLEARTDMAAKRYELNSVAGYLAKQLGEKKLEYRRAKEYKVADPDGIGKHYDLDEIKAELDAIYNDLQEAKTARSQLSGSILTYDRYLELFTNIGKNIEVGLAKSINMSALDAILRKFFLNFELAAENEGKLQWSVLNFRLKEPWNSFMKDGKVVRGGDERT